MFMVERLTEESALNQNPRSNNETIFHIAFIYIL